jgi:Family of unknown function (DUF5686)/Carboxypeptidase regulatory-like domain
MGTTLLRVFHRAGNLWIGAIFQELETPQLSRASRHTTIGIALLPCFWVLTPASLEAQDSVPHPATAVVSGSVRNAVTAAPVRTAVIRLASGTVSTLSDDNGRYHIALPLGWHRIEVRRIGFRPATATVEVQAGGTTADVTLDPLAITLDRVLITAQDDAARRIVAAAIRRKQETRGVVHDYRYDGDVRLVVRDLSKPVDSASSILLITESRTSAYWELPNRYQETIVARRQTGNLVAERNLVSVGQIVNFSRDRVQLGRFELASPIADDALDRYDYHVLDTLAVDGRRVFRLSLEPNGEGTPAFDGIIDIADSTFDVTGIDVGVNSAVRLGLLRNVRYQQRFGDMGGGRWMPRAIELTADIHLPIGSVQFGLQHIATLSGFRFNEGQRPAGLGEYRIVVADSADHADSAAWAAADARATPLTAAEQAAWMRIDSIAHAPASPLRRTARAVFGTLAVVGNPDFFHFNRVDGAYVGAGWTWLNPAAMPGTEPTLKLGHAQASGLWQYRAGDRLRLSEESRFWVGATYHDETLSRPTFTSAGYRPTLRALFSRIDPLDYYRERGLVTSLTTKLVDFVQLDAGYNDVRQTSRPLAVSKPLFGGGRDSAGKVRPMRPNDPIDDGYLRSFSTALTYDSRPMLRQAGRDVRLTAPQWTRLTIEAEVSPGRALASDFNYRRYTIRLDRRQLTLGMGVTTFLAAAGVGTSGLPVQRFFRIDGGARVLEAQAPPFGTLQDSSYTAPQAALFAVQHDFDRLLFTRSGLPLVRDIPFTLAVRGGVFWTDFPGSSAGRPVAGNPYREVGLTVGNLTPFTAPFNLAARFEWQLSHYPTSRFRFSIGFGT